MARMRVVSLNMWGDGGIQVGFQLFPQPERAYEVNHTEMATPDNATEFTRLMSVNLYDEFDIEGTPVA